MKRMKGIESIIKGHRLEIEKLNCGITRYYFDDEEVNYWVIAEDKLIVIFKGGEEKIYE